MGAPYGQLLLIKGKMSSFSIAKGRGSSASWHVLHPTGTDPQRDAEVAGGFLNASATTQNLTICILPIPSGRLCFGTNGFDRVQWANGLHSGDGSFSLCS